MEPRFLVDINVGRLAKWLRVMGYDTLFLPNSSDRDLVQIAQMEGRLLLTKDTRIFHRRLVASGKVKALLIKGDSVWEQLRQVVEELDLKPGQEFSRCIRCNQTLLPTEVEKAYQRVPPFVFAHHQEFLECPACQRLYWRGTHWSNMTKELSQLMGKSHA